LDSLCVIVCLIKRQVLEVLKCDHNHCNVVKCSFSNGGFKDQIDYLATLLVYIRSALVVVDREPSTVDAFSVGELVKDSITAQEDEVMLVLNFEGLDVWDGDDYIWVASIARELSFNVSKGS
jgi:hypothetical protein